MGQDISTAKSFVVLVSFRERSAMIKRHNTYEKAIEAAKSVKAFLPELRDREIYFTANIEKLGPDDIEVTSSAWSSIIPFVEELKVHIVGDDSGQESNTPSPPYHPTDSEADAKEFVVEDIGRSHWTAGESQTY